MRQRTRQFQGPCMNPLARGWLNVWLAVEDPSVSTTRKRSPESEHDSTARARGETNHESEQDAQTGSQGNGDLERDIESENDDLVRDGPAEPGDEDDTTEIIKIPTKKKKSGSE
nr:uncharacterized protein CTRU02_01131 [Colletotrichum truncatum]KAF6800726.1 hypothetical protein CTRU02_01131 [Colletotrichum truncatum]